MKKILTTIISILIIMASLIPLKNGGAASFEPLDSLTSPHNLYYAWMTIQGNYLGVGDCSEPGRGIEIVDISNPYQLDVIGYKAVNHMTYALDMNGGFEYVPASWDGLFIYDISDLQDIRLASHLDLGSWPIGGVVVRGGTALVGSDNNGSNGALYSVNVEDPYHPSIAWSSDSMGCGKLVLGHQMAYSYSLYNQIRIFDISDMRNPIQIKHFSCPSVSDIDVVEESQLLIATTTNDGVKIYDISNPYNPALLSSTMLPEPAVPLSVSHSKISSQIIFVSGYIHGLWALDISNPAAPETTASYFPSDDQCNMVGCQDDKVFLTVRYGLIALRYSENNLGINHGGVLPTVPALSQNYPNPFNQTTVISYSLPESRDVRLEIYDIMGREISTMVYGRQPAGNNFVTWDASDRPSGIYFYKLISGDLALSKKMILLK